MLRQYSTGQTLDAASAALRLRRERCQKRRLPGGWNARKGARRSGGGMEALMDRATLQTVSRWRRHATQSRSIASVSPQETAETCGCGQLCTREGYHQRGMTEIKQFGTDFQRCTHTELCVSSMSATIAPCQEARVAVLMGFRDARGRTRDAAQRSRRYTPEGTDPWHRKGEGFFWCTSILTPSTTRNSTSGITRNICRNYWPCPE